MKKPKTAAAAMLDRLAAKGFKRAFIRQAHAALKEAYFLGVEDGMTVASLRRKRGAA